MIIIVKYLCDKKKRITPPLSLFLSITLYILSGPFFSFSVPLFILFTLFPTLLLITFFVIYVYILALAIPSLFFFPVIHFMYFFPAITMYTFYFFSCPFSLKKNITGTQTKKNHMYMLRSYHTHTHHTLSHFLFFLIYYEVL